MGKHLGQTSSENLTWEQEEKPSVWKEKCPGWGGVKAFFPSPTIKLKVSSTNPEAAIPGWDTRSREGTMHSFIHPQ